MKKISLIVCFLFVAVLFLPMNVSAMDELKNTDPDKFFLLLDLNSQFCTVFEKDDNGEYTKVVRRFTVSTGKDPVKITDPTTQDPNDPKFKGTPTSTGIWKIGGRERFGEFVEFRGTPARYWVQVVGSIFFHSVLFSKVDVNAMQSGAYNSLGTKQSHGCVRLCVEDAKWLYYYACPGTKIKVSNTEKRNSDYNKKLRPKMPVGEYKKFQANIYDTPAPENPIGWVTRDGAKLSSGCGGDKSRTLQTLAAGDEITIMQIGDPYSKVYAGKKLGYILTSYITTEQGVTKGQEGMYNMSDTDWMYEQADKDSAKIVKVPIGTTVKILDMQDNWTKVDYTGDVGYVQTKLLKQGWGLIRE